MWKNHPLKRSSSLLQKARICWAFFAKDFKNTYRFKATIVRDASQPIVSFLSLILAYSAVFFVGDVSSVGFVDRSNYLVYLATGFLAYSFGRTCWNKTSLRWEKYMLTLEGILVAPVNAAYVLAGKAFNCLLAIGLSSAPYVILLALLRPPVVSYSLLLAGLFCLGCLFSIFLSLDFMISGLEISGEGWTDLIRTYLPMSLGFVSCVYFPPDILPKLIRPLVWINPIYISVSLFRSAFISGDINSIPLGQVTYVAVLAVVLPIISVDLFSRLFYSRGIRGY